MNPIRRVVAIVLCGVSGFYTIVSWLFLTCGMISYFYGEPSLYYIPILLFGLITGEVSMSFLLENTQYLPSLLGGLFISIAVWCLLEMVNIFLIFYLCKWQVTKNIKNSGLLINGTLLPGFLFYKFSIVYDLGLIWFCIFLLMTHILSVYGGIKAVEKIRKSNVSP